MHVAAFLLVSQFYIQIKGPDLDQKEHERKAITQTTWLHAEGVKCNSQGQRPWKALE
jgi:hypothetical protein